MLKKVTVLDIDTKHKKEIILNTNLIKSVNLRNINGQDILNVHTDSQIYQILEPMDGFLARMNSDLADELLNKFKALETELKGLYETTHKLTTLLEAHVNNTKEAYDDLVDQLNKELDALKKPKTVKRRVRRIPG